MRSPLVMVLFLVVTAAACVGPSDDSSETVSIARNAPKVTICHIPPGDPGNAHTITVPESAAAAHVAHGDSAGPCVCPPGEQWTCYSGPAGTEGVGACQGGVTTCNGDAQGYGACVGEVVPAAEACDDGIDNDCDGATDENCVCAAGSSVACYSGPPGTEGVGVCAAGAKLCADGSGYGACTGEVLPADEACGDLLDNDCDGLIDESCVCPPEVCGDGLDNDCDGIIDDGCVCAPDSTIACYEGPPGTEGVGLCTAGAQYCNGDGTAYSECVGSIVPTPDVCGDGIDNDCDGAFDEGCVCMPGSAAACYDGPPGTDGVGVCRSGFQVCDPTGMGYGTCLGTIRPLDEVCGDGLDNDCDGYTDDGCVCAPDSTSSCYDGPPGTEGVGACTAGTQTCNSIGTGYGACVGAVEPAPEACGDGLDNDCDGFADEGCCTPAPEACGDGADNDCDGLVDEGCLGDFAWIDVDRDGMQEAGELPLAGVVFLLRSASTGALVAVATSSFSGAYHFSNVPPGLYFIEVVPPVGYVTTPQDSVPGNDVRDSDFGGDGNATDTFTFSGGPDYSWDCGFHLASPG